MSQSVGSHGTKIYVRPAIADPGGGSLWAAGDEIQIRGLGDITMPGLTKNEFDNTSHDENIDTYSFGVQRRNAVSAPLFFNATLLSHKVLRALETNNNPLTNMSNGFRVVSPDGEEWFFSGGVKDMSETAPVDGTKTVQLNIRASGPFYLGGVLYGA